MPSLIRLGIRLVFGPDRARPSRPRPGPGLAEVLTLAQAAQEAGFDSIWIEDDPARVVRGGGPTSPIAGADALEAYTLLGALATATTTARLGALATAVTTRPPALLAKQVSALDVISGGRAVLGLGPPPRSAWRGTWSLQRLEEAVEVCRALFEAEEVTVHGRRLSLDHAANRPAPPQGPALPVVLAGRSGRRLVDVALRRADALCVLGERADAPVSLAAVVDARRRKARPPGHLWAMALVRTAPASWTTPPATAVIEAVGTTFAGGADGVVLDVPVATAPDTVGAMGVALVERFGVSGAGDSF